jgi:hypothetical protein
MIGGAARCARHGALVSASRLDWAILPSVDGCVSALPKASIHAAARPRRSSGITAMTAVPRSVGQIARAIHWTSGDAIPTFPLRYAVAENLVHRCRPDIERYIRGAGSPQCQREILIGSRTELSELPTNRAVI